MKSTFAKCANHLALASLSIASLEAQSTIKPILESSTNDGPWTTVPANQLQAIPDGRLWLPFQDDLVRYRLRIGTAYPSATGALPPQAIPSLSLQPEAGSFLTFGESSDLENWTDLDASSFSVDTSGLVFPASATGKSFLNLKVTRGIPSTTQYELAQLTPNPNASFRETPWLVDSPGTGGGLEGGGNTIDPFDNPTGRVPFPGAHSFNKYLFEERIHQIF